MIVGNQQSVGWFVFFDVGKTTDRLSKYIVVSFIGQSFVLSSYHLLLSGNDEHKALSYPIKPICPLGADPEQLP